MLSRPDTISQAIPRRHETSCRFGKVLSFAGGKADIAPVGASSILRDAPVSGSVSIGDIVPIQLIKGQLTAIGTGGDKTTITYQTLFEQGSGGSGTAPATLTSTTTNLESGGAHTHLIDATISRTSDVNAWQSAHLSAGDPHPQYALDTQITGTQNTVAKFGAGGVGLVNSAATEDGTRFSVSLPVRATQGIEVNGGSVVSDSTFGIRWHPGNDYAIYRQAGAWASPWPRLQTVFHTGIDLRATVTYGGIRFYDYNSGVSQSLLMSVGDGDGNVRVANTLQHTGGNWNIQNTGVAALAATTINAATNAYPLVVNSLASNATNLGVRSLWAKNVTTSGTYYSIGFDSQPTITIPAGITDSGYALSFRTDALRNQSGDQGTLQSLVGTSAAYGHYGSTSRTTNIARGLAINPYAMGGTIADMADIELGSISGGGTVTNRWSIKQVDGASRNWFAGKVGIGAGVSAPVTLLDVAGSISTLQNGIRHYRNVAHYSQNSTNVTGALLITMPVGWVSTMMKIVIEGYDYSGSAAWRCVVGGYNYSGVGWYNTDCEITGYAPFRDVTLAYDSVALKCVVVLGTTSTVWQYPQIVISDFLAGYSGMDSWGSGWNMAITTSLPTLLASVPLSPAFTATGYFSSLGSTAGYYFDDRVPPNAQWALYAHGGIARLYAGQDRFTVDQSGNFTLRYDVSNMLSINVSSTGNVSLTPSGPLINIPTSASLRSPNYASQTTGWNISGLGEGDFRYLFTDELHAKSFIADLEQALAGGQIISKSVAMLGQDFTAPAAGGTATLTVRDLPSASNMAVFQAGDYIRVRQFSRSGGSLSITDCWGTVSGYTDLSGTNEGMQSWTFTRSSGADAGAMTAGAVVQKDAIILDYGTAGNGVHEVNAIDGIYGLNSPYSQIATWGTHPKTMTIRGRFGNLRGLTGNANEFGIFAGTNWTATPTATDKFIKASSQGVDIYNAKLSLYDASTPVIVLDPATPSLAIGNPAPSGYLSSTGIFAGKHGGAYKMHVGSIASGVLQRGYSWDGTNFDVVGNVRIGPGSASYGVNIGNPRLMLRFDGPQGSYTGDATGHRGQKATMSGGVIFVPGKFGKAVQVAEATTNLCFNPSFELDSDSDGLADQWVAYNNTSGAEPSTTSRVAGLFGSYAQRISWSIGNTSTKGVYSTNACSTGWQPNTTYAISWYARASGTNVGKTMGLVWNINPASTTYVSNPALTGEWQRYVVQITWGASVEGSGNAFISIAIASASSGNLDFDGVQVEQKSYVTPYCDGSLSAGHSWSGTAHNSTSTRTAATLTYPATYQVRGDRGTIGCWLNTDGWVSWGSTKHILVSGQDQAGGSQFLRFSTDGISLTLAQRSLDGVFNAASATIPAGSKNGGWHHFVVTWNGAQALFYADGVQIGSGAITGTIWGEQTQWPTMWVGSGGANLPVPIDDLFVTDTVLAADELRAIYQSNQPVGIDSSPYSLMLRGLSGGYVLGDSTGLYGYSATGGLSFALAAADGVSAFGGTLNAGDFKFGSTTQYVSYVGGVLTIAGNGTGITSIDGGNILTGTVTAQKLLATAGGDNLVLNASFEADSDANGMGDSWGVYNNSVGVEPHTASRVTGVDGGYAQRIAWTGTNTTSKGVYSLATWVGGRRANMTYIVSWWARANTNVAVGFDTQHNIGPNLLNEWVSNPAPAIGVWQRYIKRQRWSADNSDPLYISLTYTAAVTGSVDIDHVMVHEGDVPQAYMPRAAEVLPGTVVANMIAANAITATHISAGSIIAGKIAAGAIDAMTITGPVIRTAASGARTELNSTNLFGLGVGGIGGTDGTTTQWYASASDGKLYASGGNLRIENSGMIFTFPATTGVFADRSIRWMTGSLENYKLGAYFNTSNATEYAYHIVQARQVSYKAQIQLQALAYDGLGTTKVWISSDGGVDIDAWENSGHPREASSIKVRGAGSSKNIFLSSWADPTLPNRTAYATIDGYGREVFLHSRDHGDTVGTPKYGSVKVSGNSGFIELKSGPNAIAGTANARVLIDGVNSTVEVTNGQFKTAGGIHVGGINPSLWTQKYDLERGGGADSSMEMVSTNYHYATALIFNGYSVTDSGSLFAAGSVKYRYGAGLYNNRAMMLYAAPTFGEWYFSVAPVSTGAGANVASWNTGLTIRGTGISTPSIEVQAPIAPTLQAGWQNFDPGDQSAAYWKDPLGYVWIRGMIKSGTYTDGTVLFTLPAGYRPSKREIRLVNANGSLTLGRIDIEMSGDVKCFGLTTNSWINLSNIVPFRV